MVENHTETTTETTLNQGPLMLDLQKTPRCIEGQRSCHDTIIVAIEVLVPWQEKTIKFDP